jgi:soluble lytic murein transglycosylase-like protein
MYFCSKLFFGTAVLASAGGLAIQAATAAQDAPAPHAVSVVRADSQTGRLVRTVVVKNAPAGNGDAVGSRLRALAEQTAKDHEVSPLLVDSVIQVESNYNPYALSPKGAQGLMQLMPATARRFGVTDSFDAQQNIEAGVKYLKFLQATFKDDRLAIAAYNAGEKAVTKYGDVPPYTETQNYVVKVGVKYAKAKRSAEKTEAQAKTAQAKTTMDLNPEEESARHVIQFVDAEGRLHLATR